MTSNDPVPDLASILQTLSAYAPAVSSFSSNGASHEEPTPLNREDDDYEPPASFASPEQPPVADPISRPQESTSYDPANISTPRPITTTPTPPPDPYTITTWPAALQCVMKSVSQNEAHQARIRKLIRTQHDHEKQWWAGREALLTKQKARAQKKKTMDAVLRSVGGNVDNVDISTPEEDNIEIRNYDMKVYKASVDMARALDTELRHLGTPFFAIRSELVGAEPSVGDTVGKSAVITKEELVKLQRRMLGLLEDLCKE